jgi:hypothetical protein
MPAAQDRAAHHPDTLGIKVNVTLVGGDAVPVAPDVVGSYQWGLEWVVVVFGVLP